VPAALVEKAPAKINLTLRVLGRREDGYHTLESLVAFADLADTLSLQPGSETALDISGPFADVCGPPGDNLVLKAVAALRGRVPGLKAGHFLLEKTIPVAAGMGGGSADAAAALRLLARLNELTPDDPRLAAAALSVGADVPVCLMSRPRIMRGIGDVLSAPLYVPPLSAVLVNPHVTVPTREVFAAFTATQANEKYLNNVPRGYDAMIEFLLQYGNDLTQAAIARAPVITEVLIALRALPAVRLVRMSGSGPTCFALFASQGEGAAAALRLASEREEWWVQAAIVGETETR
jgi:4-diphosphocytidyl-2-C-methyl-D-erythritol kinase